MAEIQPFRGVLYDQSKVHLDDVVAPPYDVIAPEQQEKLYERNEYNVVRLILGREEDRYASAALHLGEWLERGVLVRDARPALYILTQSFTGSNGKTIVRKGFVALCRLEEFDKKIVLPHEKTLAKPREDRLKLFQSTHTNLSQIFSLYPDSEKAIDRVLNGYQDTEPLIDVMFEEVQNRVWRLDDAEKIRQVQDLMKRNQVLIADGHHRYETALAYRDAMREKNPRHTGEELYNYVMMFFANIDDEGLVIYPTHRIVHSLTGFDSRSFLGQLEQHFILREFKETDGLLKALNSSSVRSLGFKIKGEPVAYLCTLKPTNLASQIVPDDIPVELKELDVTLLHSVVFRDLLGISVEAQEQKRNIDYVRKAEDAVAAVESGKAQIACLMNPTRIEEVRAVAKAGYTMPQKSTYFFPKLVSGLVINLLSE
ncbi:MAG: DUF1015 domain-containing protein [Bacteroidota bacterium]